MPLMKKLAKTLSKSEPGLRLEGPILIITRENQAKARFIETRRKVMDIYRSWNLSSRDEVQLDSISIM